MVQGGREGGAGNEGEEAGVARPARPYETRGVGGVVLAPTPTLHSRSPFSTLAAVDSYSNLPPHLLSVTNRAADSPASIAKGDFDRGTPKDLERKKEARTVPARRNASARAGGGGVSFKQGRQLTTPFLMHTPSVEGMGRARAA